MKKRKEKEKEEEEEARASQPRPPLPTPSSSDRVESCWMRAADICRATRTQAVIIHHDTPTVRSAVPA